MGICRHGFTTYLLDWLKLKQNKTDNQQAIQTASEDMEKLEPSSMTDGC